MPKGRGGSAGAHHGRVPESPREMAGRLALVGAVHDQRRGRGLGAEAVEQVSPRRRIVGLARGKGEH